VKEFLEEKYTERVASSYKQSTTPPLSRIFWHIGEKEVDHYKKSVKCNTLPGSKSLYSIIGFSMSDPTLLRTRALSYFCIPCIEGQWVDCKNPSHVQDWEVQCLVLVNSQAVAEQIAEMDDEENWVHDGVSAQIGDLVEVGENFMVPTVEENDNGVEYYILQCRRSKFVLDEALTYLWRGNFNVGDEEIRGKYFKTYGRGDKSYVFYDEAVDAHIDAHLKWACKFPMVLATHQVKDTPIYKMSSETKQVCEDALREWWAFNDD
jgi:hypothetical protein